MTNIAILVGNLVRDPEMRYTPAGKAVTSFRLAINEGFGENKTAVFIDCNAWDHAAESLAEVGRKGMRVMVEGRITVDKWKDKEGNNRETYRVTARNAAVIPSISKQAATEDLSDIPF